MPSVEVLVFGNETAMGTAILKAAAVGAKAAGMRTVVTTEYQGNCDWLCIHAAGQLKRRVFRAKQISKGGLVACWDHGYFGRSKDQNLAYMRVSVNKLHPQQLLDKTAPKPERWEAHGIALRNDCNKKGHIIIAGSGGNWRARKGKNEWEWQTVKAMSRSFPRRRLVYRPKPGLNFPENFGCERDERPIAEVLKEASLLVCEHSSVALDACIAGIPVICEDGAASWLYSKGKSPSVEARLDLLRRVCWWQWRANETAEAWSFLMRVCAQR